MLEAFSGATLILRIHPGGLRPATLVSVQTSNFLAEATRIMAQPSATSLSPCSISTTYPPHPNPNPPFTPPLLSLYLIPSRHFIPAISAPQQTQAESRQTPASEVGEVISDAHGLFPNLMANNAGAHTHTRRPITYNHSVHVWNNKQVEI